MIFLDTHVMLWLFGGDKNRLSQKAIILIEENDLYISPMVKLELQFLQEVKRIKYDAENIVDELSEHIGLKIDDASFLKIEKKAENMTWTRDPFDRLITAHAAMTDEILLTKDTLILKHYSQAMW